MKTIEDEEEGGILRSRTEKFHQKRSREGKQARRKVHGARNVETDWAVEA